MDLALLANPVFLAQNVVDGVARGALYAVYAMGFTLIFGVLDIINLAHAATFTWCAFVGWLVLSQLGASLPAAFAASVAAGGAIAVLLELLVFRPLRRGGSDRLAPMIGSIGASLVMVSIVEGVFGVDTRRFPDSALDPRPFFLGGAGGLRVSRAQILIVAAAVLLTCALGLFIRRTRMGKAIRAVAADQKAARLLGIDVNAVVIVTFLAAGALAGAAGILVGLATSNIAPGMGSQIELRGLAVVILGGMGNVEGAVLGGLILGLAETFAIAYLPGGSDLKDAVAFFILFLILLVRPNGILGRKTVEAA